MESHMGIDPHPVWEGIKDVAIKTILRLVQSLRLYIQDVSLSIIIIIFLLSDSCEDYIASLVKANLKNSGSVYELFGFDIMLDQHLKPWLLEVNVSPR